MTAMNVLLATVAVGQRRSSNFRSNLCSEAKTASMVARFPFAAT